MPAQTVGGHCAHEHLGRRNVTGGLTLGVVQPQLALRIGGNDQLANANVLQTGGAATQSVVGGGLRQAYRFGAECGHHLRADAQHQRHAAHHAVVV